MTSRLFHLLPLGAWQAFLASADVELRPASLASEGFCHLSQAPQLPGTLAAHFAGAGPLALLEVARAPLGETLRLEPSRGGELFPHVHAPLPRAALLRWWRLEPGTGGRAHGLPRLAEEAGADEPAGLRVDA